MTWKDIETRRLLLRRLRPEDEFTLAAALNDYEVSRWLSRVPYPYPRSRAADFIASLADADPRDRICAITFKSAPGVVIGMISYEHLGAVDAPEFGYWLARPYWRRGIMSEAAAALLAHGFDEGIEAFASGYWNPASGGLLRKLGFYDAGVKRTASLALGHEVDCTRLRLSREMWFAQDATHEKGRAA